MAWSASKDVGYKGQLRLAASVSSQSAESNSSRVKFTMSVHNGAGATTFANGAHWALKSPDFADTSGTVDINVAAGKTQTLATRTVTVAHDQDGGKHVSASFTLSGINTTVLGTGGTVSLGFSLPQIARGPWYNDRGTWRRTLCWYNDRGNWRQCLVWYNDRGNWRLVGG